MKTVLRARQTAGGLFRHLMGERDEMRRGTSPVRGWLQRLLVGHSLAVGLTVCCVWGSPALAQQSPSGSSGAAGGAAANSRPPVTTLPGGIPVPREGEVVPVPRNLATTFGAPNAVGRGPHPDFAITRRDGQVFVYDPKNPDLRYRIDFSLPQVYPPHRMSEWFGSTRFHQYDRTRVTAPEPYSPNPYLWGIGTMPGGYYWRPEDGLFPSAAREARIQIRRGGEERTVMVYDRETNPCQTYVRLRQTGIERAVDQYVVSVGILSGQELASRFTSERFRQEQGDFELISQLTQRFVEAGVVVPPHLMEETAAARCRCRAYLDTYTDSVTGMRRTRTLRDDGSMFRMIKEGLGEEFAENLRVRLTASLADPLPLTEEVFEFLYESIERTTSDFPRDEYGSILIPALSREQQDWYKGWVVPLTRSLETLAEEYKMESQRSNACNVMGPEALEQSDFFMGEKSFDDCELAQVARIQARNYTALNPSAAAANELRQIFPQDYQRLLQNIRNGEGGLMDMGRPIGQLTGQTGFTTGTQTLGSGLYLNQLDSVATGLTALCEQTKAMQSGPVGEQFRSCQRVTQLQQQVQTAQMQLQMSASLNRQRLQGRQAVLPASILAQQQLQAEIGQLMAEENLRETQAELAQLQSVCMDGRPRINYEAGVTVLQTGPCRDLEQAARTLDQATRRQAELSDSFGRLVSQSAVQGGNMSQAAREGFELQRQLQQAQREVQQQQARLRELEPSCRAQVRQVASSPGVLATLRHASPYQPALPNACESAIGAMVELKRVMLEYYGGRLGVPEWMAVDRGMREMMSNLQQLAERAMEACESAPDPLQRRFACELRVADHLRTQTTINNVLSRIQSRMDLTGNVPHEARTTEQVRQRSLNAPVDPAILDELRLLQQRGFLPAELNLNPARGTIRLGDIQEALTKLSRSIDMRNIESRELCDK